MIPSVPSPAPATPPPQFTRNEGLKTSNPGLAGTIAPIVYQNCVACHRPGEAAPFSLMSYEDVAKRGLPWHVEER